MKGYSVLGIEKHNWGDDLTIVAPIKESYSFGIFIQSCMYFISVMLVNINPTFIKNINLFIGRVKTNCNYAVLKEGCLNDENKSDM